jgi:hypothetical protein
MLFRCDAVSPMIGDATPELTCEVCGCTDSRACPGGCYWVSHDPPICSACENVEADVDRAVGSSGLFTDQRCPDSPTGAGHLHIWLSDTSGYCARCREGFVA